MSNLPVPFFLHLLGVASTGTHRCQLPDVVTLPTRFSLSEPQLPVLPTVHYQSRLVEGLPAVLSLLGSLSLTYSPRLFSECPQQAGARMVFVRVHAALPRRTHSQMGRKPGFRRWRWGPSSLRSPTLISLTCRVCKVGMIQLSLPPAGLCRGSAHTLWGWLASFPVYPSPVGPF